MNMKKRNKGKKALTAVGAVVAAGLTPGIIAATPGCLPGQGSSAGITAADVVAIDGRAYGFDELYAEQHPDSVKMDTIEINIVLEPSNATLYGAIQVISPYRNKKITKNDDVVYRDVEQMPQFPGGDAALKEYIKAHIKYPAKALKKRIEGRVIVEFVVDDKGKIGEVEVVLSPNKHFDKEAVRICKSLPKFIPGRQNGKAVSVWYRLPITFTLPEENND